MSTTETGILVIAVVGLLNALTAWISTLIKERSDERRAARLEEKRQQRADALAVDQAKIAESLAENTRMTAHAAEQATAAFHEANSVNAKLAATNQVAGEASDKLSALIMDRTEPSKASGA